MSIINHKLVAESLLARAQTEAGTPSDAALAQAYATLYLGEQQRISNLIVWANSEAVNFQGAVGAEVTAAIGL